MLLRLAIFLFALFAVGESRIDNFYEGIKRGDQDEIRNALYDAYERKYGEKVSAQYASLRNFYGPAVPPEGSVGIIDFRHPDWAVYPRPYCPALRDYQDKLDCARFYRCYNNSDNLPDVYTDYLNVAFFSCGPGTVFDEGLGVCVNGRRESCLEKCAICVYVPYITRCQYETFCPENKGQITHYMCKHIYTFCLCQTGIYGFRTCGGPTFGHYFSAEDGRCYKGPDHPDSQCSINPPSEIALGTPRPELPVIDLFFYSKKKKIGDGSSDPTSYNCNTEFEIVHHTNIEGSYCSNYQTCNPDTGLITLCNRYYRCEYNSNQELEAMPYTCASGTAFEYNYPGGQCALLNCCAASSTFGLCSTTQKKKFKPIPTGQVTNQIGPISSSLYGVNLQCQSSDAVNDVIYTEFCTEYTSCKKRSYRTSSVTYCSKYYKCVYNSATGMIEPTPTECTGGQKFDHSTPTCSSASCCEDIPSGLCASSQKRKPGTFPQIKLPLPTSDSKYRPKPVSPPKKKFKPIPTGQSTNQIRPFLPAQYLMNLQCQSDDTENDIIHDTAIENTYCTVYNPCKKRKYRTSSLTYCSRYYKCVLNTATNMLEVASTECTGGKKFDYSRPTCASNDCCEDLPSGYC